MEALLVAGVIIYSSIAITLLLGILIRLGDIYNALEALVDDDGIIEGREK